MRTLHHHQFASIRAAHCISRKHTGGSGCYLIRQPGRNKYECCVQSQRRVRFSCCWMSESWLACRIRASSVLCTLAETKADCERCVKLYLRDMDSWGRCVNECRWTVKIMAHCGQSPAQLGRLQMPRDSTNCSPQKPFSVSARSAFRAVHERSICSPLDGCWRRTDMLRRF